MPEFHAREASISSGNSGVLAGEIVLEDIDTEPYNFAARGKPTQASSKQTRNMVAGAVGRPSAESLAEPSVVANAERTSRVATDPSADDDPVAQHADRLHFHFDHVACLHEQRRRCAPRRHRPACR